MEHETMYVNPLISFMFLRWMLRELYSFRNNYFFADGWISGLDLDWITGNLYAVTTLGFILLCGTRRTFTCASLLRDQGQVEGIAVDPITG